MRKAFTWFCKLANKRRLLIGLRNSLILFQLFAIFVGSVPRPAALYPTINGWLAWNETHLKSIVWNYLYGWGVGQNWEMFSTIDNYNNIWFEAQVTNSQGKVQNVVLLNNEAMTPWQRWQRMRELFFFETIIGTSNQWVLRSFSKYLAKEIKRETGDKIEKVEILTRWKPIYLYAENPDVPDQSQLAYTGFVSRFP